MTVKTGSAWAGTFVTLDATGALATPSTGPAGTLYVDGVANGATVTITGSNPYKFAVTLPSLTAGQRVDMYITATISSIATAGVVASAQADTVLTSDVKTETAAILEDTGNTLDGLIKDVPTVAEFEARTKPAADYALEATLTAIKGAGWTNETLAAIDTLIDAIKAKSDLIPAQPAAVGSAMTLTSAYDAAKSAASQSSVNAIPTAPLLAANYTAPDNAGITAIKAKTDNLPASPAAVGSLMGLADGAITDAKIATDALSAAKIKADAVTKIQNGLAKPGDAMTLTGAYDKAKDDVLTPLAAAKSVVDAVKAKTDNLPASPAAVGSAMTLTPAYDKAKDDVLTPLATVDSIVDAIKAKTDNLPASPAATGAAMTLTSAYDAAKTAATQASVNAIPTTPLLAANYTAPDNASITAIKAKTDLIPATPAQAGEYTSALSAIQADLDNPNQYKADVSALATTTHLQEVEDKVDTIDTVADAIKLKTDTIPASPAQAGEYTAAIAAIPTTPLLAANYTAPDNASISAIKAKTDTIPASPAVAGEYTASIAAIQADLDNPNQYKADVSGIPDALLAKVIVDTLTLKQVLKVLAAIEIGTTTGGGTASFTYTGKDGTTVQLTGVDEDGNRTAVVVTPGA